MKTVKIILSLSFIVLLAAFGNAIVANAESTINATEAPGTEICFPKASWNAYDEDRPCDMIWRPFEDGSTTLYLGTVGADAAVCNIPNPYEERNHFAIICHRVPNE